LVHRLDAEPNYVGQYLPGMLIGGAGVGLILPSFTASAVMAVPPARLAPGIAGDGVPQVVFAKRPAR
jgi:hypothetical protein